MATKKIKVVQLLRVSTPSQSLKRQHEELDALCEKKGWEVIKKIEEIGSGSRNNREREAIKIIEEMAQKQMMDKVVLQELSRLGRKTGQSISLIEKLSEMGVSVYEKSRNIETLNEDGSPNAISSMILSVLASLHSMESAERNARIRSGIRSRMKAGLHFGRPSGSNEEAEKFLSKYPKLVQSFMNKEGLSFRKRAKLYNTSVNTVRKVLSILEESGLQNAA